MSKRLKVVVLGVMGYRVHAALHVDSEYGNHTKNSFGRVQVNDLNQALITTRLDVVIGVMPQVFN
jgi:hypothetical protein